MSLATIKEKILDEKYSSLASFLADVKWGWHSLRYFLFSLSKIYFQPSRVEGLKPALEESEEPFDSNKVDFNPLGLNWAEISALKVQK